MSGANPTEGSFVTAVNPSCFTGFDVFLGDQTSNLFKKPAKRRYIGQALIMYHFFFINYVMLGSSYWLKTPMDQKMPFPESTVFKAVICDMRKTGMSKRKD